MTHLSTIKTYSLYKFFIIIISGFIITALLTWPFITKVSSYYKDSGDYAVLGSLLRYNQQAFVSGLIFDQEKYYRGYQFYPQPSTIAYTDNVIVYSLIYSVIFLITNNLILSVNLFIFFNFVLSFVSAFYLVNHFLKNMQASLFGAAVCVFNPYTLTQYPDHIFGYYSLFLVLLFLFRLLKKPNRKDAVFLGISLIIISLTSVYLFIFSLLLLPIISLPFIAAHIYYKDIQYLYSLVKYGVLTVLFIPAILYCVNPYLQYSKNEGVTRTIEQTYFFSARIIDWLSASPYSLVYGSLVRSYENIRAPGIDVTGVFNYPEHTLFLNILPFVLFILGLIYIYRYYPKLNFQEKLTIVCLFIILLTSFILTFGPYFMGFNGNQGLFKLPFYYLYQGAFLLKGTRVPTRFEIIFYPAFAVIVAYGVYNLILKINHKKTVYLFLAVLFLGLIIENFTVRDFSQTSVNMDKLNDINFQRKISFLYGKKVLHLPVHIPELGEWSFYTLNWNTILRSTSVNGVSGSISADQLNFLMKLKNSLGDKELKELSAINVDYLIIHKELLGKEGEKYKDNWNLYQQGMTYEDSELLVVDISKYRFSYRICDFDKDISQQLTRAKLEGVPGEFYIMIIKNNSDCYLPSIYEAKYKRINFGSALLGIGDNTASYRLPVVIGPYEQVILNEPAHNLIIN